MHCALASSAPAVRFCVVALCVLGSSLTLQRSGPTSTDLSFWLQKFWTQDWIDGLEVKGHCLLFQKTQVQVSATIWWLIAVCDYSCPGSNTLTQT